MSGCSQARMALFPTSPYARTSCRFCFRFRFCLRSALIRSQLPGIDAEKLKASGIGRSVMLLMKHPKETPANRRLAEELVERWSRPIFQLAERYADQPEALEEMAKRPVSRLPTTERELSSLDRFMQERRDKMLTYRARIPNRDPLDYVKPPRSAEAGPTESPPVQGASAPRPAPNRLAKGSKFEGHIKGLSKAFDKNPRAMKPSLEGRGMHM
jgi:transcription factor SPN1